MCGWVHARARDLVRVILHLLARHRSSSDVECRPSTRPTVASLGTHRCDVHGSPPRRLHGTPGGVGVRPRRPRARGRGRSRRARDDGAHDVDDESSSTIIRRGFRRRVATRIGGRARSCGIIITRVVFFTRRHWRGGTPRDGAERLDGALGDERVNGGVLQICDLTSVRG